MAIKEVLVPELSESVAEATLLEWKKQPGEAVEADEILIEVETDKVVLEVPAPASGVLSEIIKGDGSTVLAGEVLARIDTEAQPQAPLPTRAMPLPNPPSLLPKPRAPKQLLRPKGWLQPRPQPTKSSPKKVLMWPMCLAPVVTAV